jgi:uncharacterized protein (DUF433 family)
MENRSPAKIAPPANALSSKLRRGADVESSCPEGQGQQEELGEEQGRKAHGAQSRIGIAMHATNRIEVNPNVMMGKPVIRGTRIPVELVLRKLGEGATEADLLDAYPRLTPEDIRAALAYAADTLAHEETLILEGPAKP